MQTADVGWLWFVAVAVGGALIGAGLTFALRRVNFGHPEDDPLAGIKLQGIYTIYAVILGFVVFTSWAFYLDSANEVRTEASSISVISRDARALPPEQSKPIQEAAAGYLVTAAGPEWDKLQDGVATQEARKYLQELTDAIVAVNGSPSIENLQDEMLYRMGQLDEARSNRIMIAEEQAPNFVWGVLGLGGLLVVALSALLHFRSQAFQVVLVASMSAIIAMALFTVYMLDHPFQGPFPLRPTALEKTAQFITNP